MFVIWELGTTVWFIKQFIHSFLHRLYIVGHGKAVDSHKAGYTSDSSPLQG